MLINGDCTGEKIVVLGGGLVGCEAALHLDYKGKDVTIVEQLDELLLTVKHATNNDLAIKKLLSDSSINIMTSSTIVSADTGKVTVNKNGKSIDIPCDTLIFAVGYYSDKSLEEALEGIIPKVITIGDNVKPGKIIDAVHQGFHTARLLEELC
jgi:2-enoate reductase